MRRLLTKLLYVVFFLLVTVILTTCTVFVIRMLVQLPSEGTGDISAILITESSIVEDSTDDVVKIEYDTNDFEESRYGYLSLTVDGQTELYDKIDSGIYYLTTEKDSNGHYRTSRFTLEGVKLTEGQIRQTVNAFIYDNPEIFWLENLFGYTYVGDNTLVELYSELSADECQEAIELFTAMVEEVTALIDLSQSEYEREKAVHDYLVQNCTYKDGVSSSSDGWEYFSSYGALVMGEAVCEGYAKAFDVLLAAVGIESHTIRGESLGVGHMWNVVKLDGDWYHVDTTWDDSDDKESYEYFNVSSEYILQDHTINDDIGLLSQDEIDDGTAVNYNFFVPEAESMELNYYQVEALRFSDFDDENGEAFVQALVETAQNSGTYLYILFDGDLTYEEYLNGLFYESPYKFYYYVQEANERLDSEHQIDKDGMSIIKNETAMTLRVKLAYEADEE